MACSCWLRIPFKNLSTMRAMVWARPSAGLSEGRSWANWFTTTKTMLLLSAASLTSIEPTDL
jgi:hypothetical protein